MEPMETQSNPRQAPQNTETAVSAQRVEPRAIAPEGDADIERIEALLKQRAGELRELRNEHGRQASLMRGLASRFEELSPPTDAGADHAGVAPTGDAAELQSRLTAATTRVLDAEAARAEALFKLDEVTGALRAAQTSPSGSSAGGEGQESARLEGTARGLQSVVAELTEARDTAQARLMLAEHDLEDGAGRERDLERRLVEQREQLEYEVARSHTADNADNSDNARLQHRLAGLEGERSGLGLRAAEAEHAVQTLAQSKQQVVARLSKTADELGAARAELGSTKTNNEAMAARINEMELHLARERKRASELRQGVESASSDLSTRESELSSLRTECERLRQSLEQVEVGELAKQDSLRSAASAAERAHQRAERETAQLGELLGETRDALVALGAGVEQLSSGPAGAQATEGLATVAGDMDAPGLDPEAPTPDELLAQLKARHDRIDQLERQHTADTDTHTASVASHRAQLELSRAEASTMQEQLARQQARLDAARAAARSIGSAVQNDDSVRPRVAELLQLLAD